MKRLLLSFAFLLTIQVTTAQVKVTFYISNLPAKTPEPKAIYLAGNFNGWLPAKAQWQFTSEPIYQVQQTLAPGNYEYKIVRGAWDKVECGANGGPFGNRTLHVVHDTLILLNVADWQDLHPPIQRVHTASAQVHIISEKFDMPQLGKQRRVWIYLPKGYETNKKKYPVIYMHDGQNLFDGYTSGFGEWGLDEFLDSLKTGQQQFIVVGIDHGGEARVVEYSPYESKYGKPLGSQYVDFLVETLKPYIDSHYHTLSDAKHTTVAGSSMGGLISMYAELKYPKVFGSAGVFSPAFWINPPIYDQAKTAAEKAGRFYFVCGDQEGDSEVADMYKMATIVNYKMVPYTVVEAITIKGAKHNEAQWRGDFPAFYKWLVAGMK